MNCVIAREAYLLSSGLKKKEEKRQVLSQQMVISFAARFSMILEKRGFGGRDVLPSATLFVTFAEFHAEWCKGLASFPLMRG